MGLNGVVVIGGGVLSIPSELACRSLVHARAFELLELDEHKFYQGEKGLPSDMEHAQEDWMEKGYSRRFRSNYLQNRERIDAYLYGRDLSQITKEEVHVLLHD